MADKSMDDWIIGWLDDHSVAYKIMIHVIGIATPHRPVVAFLPISLSHHGV